MNQIKSEDSPVYLPKSAEACEAVVGRAIAILEDRLKRVDSEVYDTPDKVRKLLFLKLAEKKSEVFCIMFLDNRHRMIAFEEMFRGTIDGASVFPREVVRAVIEKNAAAVILAHNHPSGVPLQSQADIRITKRLVDALGLIDVKVLDSMVVGDTCKGIVSLAERGLM